MSIISQHVCEHWNYRVCFIENGKCKNCGWKTPELEAIDKEIAYEKEDFEESKIKRKDQELEKLLKTETIKFYQKDITKINPNNFHF